MNEEELLIDKTEIIKNIIDFKNDVGVQKLQSLYFSKSFPEIFSISRREMSHSAFIAWLLDNKENHLLSFFPIQKFLEIVALRGGEQSENLSPSFFNSILTDNYTIHSVNVEKEKTIKNGRLDIYAEVLLTTDNKDFKVKLIVENKVGSKEQGDQTSNYFQYFEDEKEENEINLYVYLTPLPTMDLNELLEPECSCKNFIQINYQYLVDYMLEPALNQNIPDKTRFIITEYLHSLSQPSLDDEQETSKQKQKQSSIMALGKEEKELLTNFWKKNEKLIRAAMYSLSTDQADPEVRKKTRDLLNALPNSEKDFGKITVFYDGTPFKESFAKTDIGLHTVRLLDEKSLIDEDVFGFLKADRSSGCILLKTKSEMSESELKHNRYRTKKEEPSLIYKDEEYFVIKDWNPDNTDKFIKKITGKFDKIKYEKND